MVVARVVPDVTGLDREFDYTVPDELLGALSVGDRVRVPLHGRRVGGWVVALDPADGPVPVERLKPLVARSGLGPDEVTVGLARWASHRWAGRLRALLVSASPPTIVRELANPAHGSVDRSGADEAIAEVLATGGGLVRRPPAAARLPVVLGALHAGPLLVVAPSIELAEHLAARLAERGATVALLPRQWGRAAAGCDVVIGARAATWARCGPLGAIVLLDEHDEALQEERTPTWHARDVLAERARRLGVPFVAVSPSPTVSGLQLLGAPVLPSRDDERAGWPLVEIVDRTQELPWKRSLVSSRLQEALRDPARRVVCVLNTKGRARVVACGQCRELQRCERCDAAVALDDDGRLACGRCGAERPPVCLVCGASSMRLVRPGVTRMREELEAAAHRPVVAVVADTPADELGAADVLVGTEAVLHRARRADVVAFLDLDAELLAPRYRAAEQAMALIVRAARLLGPRQRGGRLLVQTFVPEHEVLRAAVLADPARVADAEAARRRELGFPPVRALAAVSGSGADEFAASLRDDATVTVQGPVAGIYVVRTDSWDVLGDALGRAPRPPRSRLRIEVDPPRL